MIAAVKGLATGRQWGEDGSDRRNRLGGYSAEFKMEPHRQGLVKASWRLPAASASGTDARTQQSRSAIVAVLSRAGSQDSDR